MTASEYIITNLSRCRLLRRAGLLGAIAVTARAWADNFVDLDLPGGPGQREPTATFPQKGRTILQRTRPPLLETPFEVFDQSVFTPNNRFYVRRRAPLPEMSARRQGPKVFRVLQHCVPVKACVGTAISASSNAFGTYTQCPNRRR